MFIDEATIFIKSGDGGPGCVSFLREKYRPKGGPDGGNGGEGADVIIEASSQIKTLIDFRHRPHFKAEKGQQGGGKNMSGKSGNHLIIKVPIGTQLFKHETNELIIDLLKDKDQILIAKGGRGGKGNAHFSTATRQTPRFAQPGTPGEEIKIKLELKLIADVGIIGCPNAGKSTLLSKISAAKPKIAPYPFTTLSPNLGVVQYQNFETFVAADIPGLIEGAHTGLGLGDKFLKHIERTSIILHLIDISDPDYLNNFEIINNELKQYSLKLAKKPQIVCLNKTDMVDEDYVKEAKKEFKKKKVSTIEISGLAGKNIHQLITTIYKKLHSCS